MYVLVFMYLYFMAHVETTASMPKWQDRTSSNRRRQFDLIICYLRQKKAQNKEHKRLVDLKQVFKKQVNKRVFLLILRQLKSSYDSFYLYCMNLEGWSNYPHIHFYSWVANKLILPLSLICFLLRTLPCSSVEFWL